jgi:uncharacterized protein YjbI with pentapeptide repeats
LIEADIIKRLEVSLANTDLKGADLIGADLDGAILHGAILNDAPLIFANLIDANLCGARFKNTNLYGARLKGANLYGAQELTEEQLEEAYLCETELPGGLDINPNRDCGKPHDEWLSEKVESLLKERS